MKKILMILDNAFKPDLRVQKEINTLTALGFIVYLFCWDKDSQLPEEINDNSLRIRRIKVTTKHQLRFAQIKKLLKFYFLLLRRIKKEKKIFHYVYVHDFLMLPIGVYIKLKKRIPLIYDAHEIYHLMEWQKYHRFVCNIMFIVERLLLKLVNHFFVVSKVSRNFYSKYINKEIIILGNWYDPYMNEEIDLREKLGISKYDLVFGYFGGLSRKARGIDHMINSVLEIPKAHLLIAGSGVDYNYIEKVAKMNDRIHFLGWLANLRKYFNNVNYILYFINSKTKYHNYSSPNALYLSISHGIPLITNVPGEPGMFIKNYNIGFLIKENEKLIDKIELNVQSDNYKKIVKNIMIIRNKYSWAKSFDIYSNILKVNGT